MGNQKWALWEHCVSPLWVCLLPFKTRTLCAVCIDKTHEYLGRAIYHLTPLAPPFTQKKYSLYFPFCAVAFVFTQHVINVTSSLLCGRFHQSPHCVSSLSSPTEKWRTLCRCSVSSSAWPSASLMSAWPLWSFPQMFWGVSPCRSLFPFKSAPFSYSPCLSWLPSLLAVSTGLS